MPHAPGEPVRLPLSVVLVEGVSMLPTLKPGECLLVRHFGPVRPGSVVVAAFPARPSLAVVKRAVRRVGPLWEVASDNPVDGVLDSRTTGPAHVSGVVVLRYWPLPPARL